MSDARKGLRPRRWGSLSAPLPSCNPQVRERVGCASDGLAPGMRRRVCERRGPREPVARTWCSAPLRCAAAPLAVVAPPVVLKEVDRGPPIRIEACSAMGRLPAAAVPTRRTGGPPRPKRPTPGEASRRAAQSGGRRVAGSVPTRGTDTAGPAPGPHLGQALTAAEEGAPRRKPAARRSSGTAITARAVTTAPQPTGAWRVGTHRECSKCALLRRGCGAMSPPGARTPRQRVRRCCTRCRWGGRNHGPGRPPEPLPRGPEAMARRVPSGGTHPPRFDHSADDEPAPVSGAASGHRGGTAA